MRNGAGNFREQCEIVSLVVVAGASMKCAPTPDLAMNAYSLIRNYVCCSQVLEKAVLAVPSMQFVQWCVVGKNRDRIVEMGGNREH